MKINAYFLSEIIFLYKMFWVFITLFWDIMLLVFEPVESN